MSEGGEYFGDICHKTYSHEYGRAPRGGTPRVRRGGRHGLIRAYLMRGSTGPVLIKLGSRWKFPRIHLRPDCRSGYGLRRCRRGAVCRPQLIFWPLVAAPRRWLRRNSLIFLGFGFSCQREGRQFESGLVLHTNRARPAKQGGLFLYLVLDVGFWFGASRF